VTYFWASGFCQEFPLLQIAGQPTNERRTIMGPEETQLFELSFSDRVALQTGLTLYEQSIVNDPIQPDIEGSVLDLEHIRDLQERLD
jgi:hypothetical protein